MGDRRVHVLVCGERLRGDDAAALLAAEALTPGARALAEILEVGQLAIETLVDIPEGVALIVADAAIGVAAGQVVVVPLEALAGLGGTAASAAPSSSHTLPPDLALALAGELRGAPLRGSFVGIGVASFGLGEELSPLVSAAMPEFIAALDSEIRRLGSTSQRRSSTTSPLGGSR
jgi:hydrogenase maturation protease